MSEVEPTTYWAVDDLLLAGPRPGPRLLELLESTGIDVIVNLTENDYQDTRFDVRHLPVRDWEAPTLEQVAALCDLIDETEAGGGRVYLHCAAGCGRTGTMVACVFVDRERMTAAAAIQRVRTLRPCSVETAEQEALVVQWEELRWR